VKVLLALTLSLTALTSPPPVDLAGTVNFGGCSGAVVRLPGATDSDPALLLTNGHCDPGPGPIPDEVVTDQPANLPAVVLDAAGNPVRTLRTVKALYVTMSGTDIALYQLKNTYAELGNVRAWPLATGRPRQGIDIRVVSGGLKQVFSCRIDGFAYRVLEKAYVTKDVVRYTPECQTGPGSSGSPVVDPSTGELIAINNTSNRDGGQCTENNPCEMDRYGNISVHRGIAYATQTYWITTCLTPGNRLDLTKPGCLLPD
jgi:hypothetical protein